MPQDPATTDPTQSNPAPRPGLNPGDTVGDYRVVQQLGKGDGASVLWRAQDTAGGGDVVIQQLIPGSPAARERSFLKRCEQTVAKQQALEGQVRRVVFFKALADDPRGAFLIRDFVNGASVGQLLDSRPDPFDLVRGLRIVHSVAKVLEQIHGYGLIHGGLRPGSILLRLSGGVQVGGIGVAALIADQEALDANAARYMAPELFHGVAPDAKSDIYALGVIAYEMLAGRGAFEHLFSAVLGDDRNAALRWMKWHTNPRVSPPSLHEVNPLVPIRLSELIARMMAKDRAKRIASAAQLLEAIQRHFGTKAIEQAEASPDAFTPSSTPIETTGPGDTTELPPVSRTPKIIAIAALVLGLLAGGAYVTVKTIRSNAYQQRLTLARDALNDADRAYKAGRFEDALGLYEKQAAGWPEKSDPIGDHGRAGAMLARVQLALAGGDYADARSKLIELDMIGEAGPADREAVKALSDEVERRETFDETVASIQAHLDAGEFAQASDLARQTQREGLTEAESQTLLDLQVQIDAQLDSKQTDEALAHADELAETGDLIGAINHLMGVHRRESNPRIAERLKALTFRRDFAKAVEEGESAERSDRLDEAIDKFEQALAMMDDEALSARVLVLKSRTAVAKGRKLSESGDEAGALAAFTTALGYDPQNAEARGWLARMNVSMEKRSQVEAARRAEALGELEQAAGHYRAALEHGADEELATALDGVESSIALGKAEQLMDAGRLDEAGKELAKARLLTPDRPAVAEALERHDRLVRYRENLRRGDGFAEQGRYAQATQAYRDARDIMDTDEINKRLDDTEFNHLLAQARGYIANEQWASARGILNTAARLRITDELTALRDEVARQIDQEAARKAEEDDG